MHRRIVIGFAVVPAVVLALGAAGAFGSSPLTMVTYPYCHNSDNNVKGQCVLRQQIGSCSEDYYAAHHNKSICLWCGGAGQMTRLEAWLD